MVINFTTFDIVDESCLLCFRQSVTLWLFPVVAFLDFCHSAGGGIDTDITVTHGHRKDRVDDGVNDLHGVGLKSPLSDEAVIISLDI